MLVFINNDNKQHRKLQQMYSQIKSSYKKSRQQFLQQIKTMRKNLQEKQMGFVGQTYLDRIIRTRRNYSMLEAKTKTKINNANLKGQLTVIEDYPQRISYQFHNPQVKQKIYNKRVYRSSKMLITPQYIKRQNSVPHQQINSRVTTPESNQVSFEPYFFKIPTNRQRRSNGQLTPALNHLRQHNKLFTHLDQYICLCFLKIGYYHEVQAGAILYGVKFDKKSFYVVLSGQLYLINSNIGLKKVVSTGDTLGEEMFFGVSPNKHLLEHAKAAVKTYVLEIKTNDYISMAEQLNRLGFSKYLEQFQDILRDGFTDKNIARNEHLIERKKLRMRTQF